MSGSYKDILYDLTSFHREALSQFSEMTGWSENQLVELKKHAVTAYGATSSWDGGVLATVNVIIGKTCYAVVEFNIERVMKDQPDTQDGRSPI